ncbi:DNA translocase FtsK 4TM domain-containing protein [Lutimonas halocynthiae]|uniref:FtsK/SpoIIIE family DNA translocase n=1 Tax=Lutimonas halocynthiae TaxID=1446477 RepID=UPI0025B34602|nr:DNA translocase FtsK [Lutimonas halocynthiae]MDN3643439.1 DNA translocase FtsK 4TM domain-containing protein [Lutimonas halocynthiae]
MAKGKKRTSRPKKIIKKPNSIVSFFKSQQTHLVFGVLVFSSAIFLLISFYSFLQHWKEDQSILANFSDKTYSANNLLGKLGANLSDFFVYDGFGVATFIIPILLFFTGLYIILHIPVKQLSKSWVNGLITMIWISLGLAYLKPELPLLGGKVGFEMNEFLQIYIGGIGVLLLLLISFFVFIIASFKITPAKIKAWMPKPKPKLKKDPSLVDDVIEEGFITETIDDGPDEEIELELDSFETLVPEKELEEAVILEPEITLTAKEPKNEKVEDIIKEEDVEKIEIEVEGPVQEEHIGKNLSNTALKDFGEFDPRLELSKFRFPELNLLKDYSNENIHINKQELENNKNKIVETLNNYKIGIASIKATIGPTVTLYEIVPEAGVRISKIKNLEDDIALSLSALGIRIIAPIPGRGTIGIEVPNKNPSIVSMKSVLSSQKFQNTKMELPIALGKTISNETFVIDLAKMPHLLMAGATGQGKSVGLNAVLASLLYKKHPAEVKFVLVDPKKVELTLFNKIERHYLAKLPDTEEAIITDTTMVINTLNSLCIEMDNRYDLLKNAYVRNIKEYNTKFIARKLNPENGHKFLPYIVLVIDEFADLIMTAGKEIEVPIARLAQLARAIGIHLIVATQRPSVNVITGIIKANFPARVAFRVTSKIDSRTILDSQGADQLIGKGDMLISTGNDLTRLQCAFIDTPEVENLTDFIGSQRAYPAAYNLPEYVGEENGTSLDIDIESRDKLFGEAAKLVVIAQQGSASLLQRKLKLGYNRAGRIIDQLEAANIVGPFEGSKARQVLVTDMVALQQLLDNEQL